MGGLTLTTLREKLVKIGMTSVIIGIEPHQQYSKERGKVTGTPVGCACGEGVIDWARVIKI